MALECGLEGWNELLKLVKRHAREIQELHWAGLQLGEPYTSHGACLLSLYCDVRGASYHKESGINSNVLGVRQQSQGWVWAKNASRSACLKGRADTGFSRNL